MIFSGINQEPNLTDDLLISGTVGPSLQDCKLGLSVNAISVDAVDNLYLNNAAKLTTLFAKRIGPNTFPPNTFFNKKLLSLPQVKVIVTKTTGLARAGYIDRIKKRHDGRRKNYLLSPQWIKLQTKQELWEVGPDTIFITILQAPLLDKSSPVISNGLYSKLPQG